MKNNSFLYYFTRPLAHVALRVFFRKIHLANRDQVPWDKPLILAANHPAAFMEPCLLSVLQPRTLHFLVHGAYFAKPLYNTLLRSYNMLPIYSREDGLEKIKRNPETLGYCYQLLSQHKPILIMAEGHTLHEKRLRPIQKGTARLAFGALDEHPDLDLYLVPIAVNYTYADRFRSEVMFEFAPPIRIQDYYSEYISDKAQALRQMTNRLTKDLKDRVIHIEDREDEVLAEQLLQLNRNNYPKRVFPIHVMDNAQLEREYDTVTQLNELSRQPVEKKLLREDCADYFEQLEKHQLTDRAVAQPQHYSVWNTILLVLGFVPFLVGYVLNIWPSFVPQYIGRNLIGRREFYSSILVSVGLLSYLIYYVLLFIIALFVQHPILWAVVLLAPPLGYFILLYRELFERWNESRKVRQQK
ncbi:MAG: 1-acyl-sn-glycerol-3-phosphate acyltransferase, partial [Bacteroidota bacterium]